MKWKINTGFIYIILAVAFTAVVLQPIKNAATIIASDLISDNTITEYDLAYEFVDKSTSAEQYKNIAFSIQTASNNSGQNGFIIASTHSMHAEDTRVAHVPEASTLLTDSLSELYGF